MPADIDIQVIGLKEFQQKFGSFPIQQTLDNVIKKIIIKLQGEAIKESPVDRWQLRSSFTTSFSPLKWILSNPKEYARFVHEWTAPHNPPFQAIKDRANRKWLPRFPIRLSISRKWTKSNPFMNRAIETVDKEIDSMFSKEIDDLFTRYWFK